MFGPALANYIRFFFFFFGRFRVRWFHMDSTSLAAWTEILHWKVPWEYVQSCRCLMFFWILASYSTGDMIYAYSSIIVYLSMHYLYCIVILPAWLSNMIVVYHILCILLNCWWLKLSPTQDGLGCEPPSQRHEKKVNRDPLLKTYWSWWWLAPCGGAPQWMGRSSHETGRNPFAELGITRACLVMYTVGR